MGIFDIFSTSDQEKAAQDQIRGLNAAYGQASGNINQGIGALNTSYGAALQPFTQNYGQAQAGVNQLMAALGIGGQGGGTSTAGAGGSTPTPVQMPTGGAALAGGTPQTSILDTLRNTPGYKFQQQTLDDTVNAQAAATGQNASGNQLLALNKVNQGLADSTYSNYVSQLMPFLGASGNAATGIAGVNTGLGNSVAGQYDTLANLGYQTQTGIGNANANADLAGLTQSKNIIGAGLDFAKLAASFSDERLKENIQPVGELFDGQPVYKYRYIGDPRWQIGLMAQDVEKTNPDAVVEIGGYKAVYYDKATEYAADLARFLEAA